MGHPLQGWRVVEQPDGRMAFYRPDGTFDGYGRRLPKSNAAGATLRRRGRPAPAVKHAAPPPAPPSTGRYVEVVGLLNVGREVRRAAQEAADTCADDLGIKRCEVRWFDDATPARLLKEERSGPPERFDAEECIGVFRMERPSAIFVKVTDDPRQAAMVAAHETAHRAQFLARGRPMRDEVAALEAEAHGYSDSFMAWLDRQGGAA